MGAIVYRFPRGHARAPASLTPIEAKASKVMSGKPRDLARRAKVNQWAEGMPLTRQTLTVDGASASAVATSLVPPRESMTESGVIMEANVVCDLQTCQEFAQSKTTFGTSCGAMSPMADSREVIFGRLEALRLALHKREPWERFDVEGRFAEAIGIHKTSWSQIKKFTRDFPINAAFRVKERWQIPLDWIYYGDVSSGVQLMAEIGRGPVVQQPRRATKRKAG